MDILFSIFAFILLVGILVIIHEGGHYFAARFCNVKVLRYSVGFGKIFWSKKYGLDQTEYCVSAIPLGGYVQLLDERSEDVDPNDKHRAFNNQSATKRIFILFAGPLANFIFSILAYMTMFSIGVPGQAPIIGEVELNSIAYENNIRSGDKIISVGEKSVTTWQTSLVSMIGEILKDEKIELLLVDKTNNQKKINLDLTGRTKELTAPNALFSGLGLRPFQPIASPVIVNTSPNSPAEKSGLLAKDTILKLNNVSVKNPTEFSEMIGSRPNETIELEIQRGNEIYKTTVLLESSRDNPSKGFIGISMTIDQAQLEQYLAIQKYSFPKNFTMAVAETNQMIVLTLNMFGKMISGQISGKNLSGPVGIAKDAGTVAKRGLIATLSFMAIISVSLGILNLLPLPVLDGGQIVFVLIEKVIRRPLPDKIQMVFQQIGVGALLFLMVFALYNDVIRLFS